jgi:hypothetical protein
MLSIYLVGPDSIYATVTGRRMRPFLLMILRTILRISVIFYGVPVCSYWREEQYKHKLVFPLRSGILVASVLPLYQTEFWLWTRLATVAREVGYLLVRLRPRELTSYIPLLWIPFRGIRWFYVVFSFRLPAASCWRED